MTVGILTSDQTYRFRSRIDQFIFKTKTMQLHPKHFAAILDSDRLSKAIEALSGNRFQHPPTMNSSNHPQNFFDEFYDDVFDIWVNNSPVVEEFSAEQSKGVYVIQICGVPGAYYVQAMEYDNEGPFTTLAEARQAIEYVHGEFLI